MAETRLIKIEEDQWMTPPEVPAFSRQAHQFFSLKALDISLHPSASWMPRTFLLLFLSLNLSQYIKAHTNRAKRNGNTVFCLMATTVFLLDVLHWICMKMGCKSVADSAAVFFKVVSHRNITLKHLITRHEIIFAEIPVLKRHISKAILFYSEKVSENLLIVVNKLYWQVYVSLTSRPEWHWVALIGCRKELVDMAYFEGNRKF
ncbi:hypothetical protein ACET3Z_026263 [Daucus carota]